MARDPVDMVPIRVSVRSRQLERSGFFRFAAIVGTPVISSRAWSWSNGIHVTSTGLLRHLPGVRILASGIEGDRVVLRASDQSDRGRHVRARAVPRRSEVSDPTVRHDPRPFPRGGCRSLHRSHDTRSLQRPLWCRVGLDAGPLTALPGVAVRQCAAVLTSCFTLACASETGPGPHCRPWRATTWIGFGPSSHGFTEGRALFDRDFDEDRGTGPRVQSGAL